MALLSGGTILATIVVCLDGTNQVKLHANPTNIARIFDSLGGVAVDAGNGSFETMRAGPPASNGKYLPGVGSQGDPVLRLLGNAFGDGITEPIVRGYTFLSRNHTTGDKIFISGFSRGAAAARALAGLVATQGLLDKTKYDVNDKTGAYLRAIAAWYAYRSPKPDFADQTRLALKRHAWRTGPATQRRRLYTAASYSCRGRVRYGQFARASPTQLEWSSGL
jgi:uncharacterized protein (DUF2235 family)